MPTTTRVERAIYKRGPHQFQVKIRRNGEHISQTFETLAQARKFRDVTLGRVLARDYVDTKKERRTTLRALLERYVTEITPTKRGKRQEANRIKAWMATDLAAFPIVTIEPKDIAPLPLKLLTDLLRLKPIQADDAVEGDDPDRRTGHPRWRRAICSALVGRPRWAVCTACGRICAMAP